MINTMINIDEIEFEEMITNDELIESIRQRGIAIPVHVIHTANGYKCADGRKRLNACRILCKEDKHFADIPVMIQNDYSKAGSSFWGHTQNLH